MKKFWIVMLAVAMLMAFTAPVFAAVGGVDVQFSGNYRVRGWYDDNIGSSSAAFSKGTVNNGQAFYDNRLRIETTFKIAEGLKLVTRFDALEKKWGQNLNYSGNTAIPANNNNDNISFERAYVSFTTGIGTVNVGYQDWQRFGTQFVDSDFTYPGIKYINSFGPLTILAGIEKRSETQTKNMTTYAANGNQLYTSGYVDIDQDVYDLGFIYKFKGGDAGLLYQFYHINDLSQSATQKANAYKRTVHLFDLYGKYKFGPVYVEAEAFTAQGTWIDYAGKVKTDSTSNVSLDAWGLYLNAEVEFKPLYAGAKYVYVTGDDGQSSGTGDNPTRHGSVIQLLSLGQDHDFALMIGNYEYFNQITGTSGWPGTLGPGPAGLTLSGMNYSMDNINAWQVYVGVKPTPKLDVRVAFTDAYMQVLPYMGTAAPVISNHIGSEIDLRASYKIFDNLTYSIGAAYFFTGDYFKGQSDTNQVTNDYLLMHQLLLSF
jgi:hypothetical protein